MNKMKLIYSSIGLIFCIQLSSFAIAQSASDPCDNIPGTWTGNWDDRNTGCISSMETIATKTTESVKLFSRYTSQTGCKPKHSISILQGTCSQGHLDLKYVPSDDSTFKIRGEIIDDVISLENEHGYSIGVLIKDK